MYFWSFEHVVGGVQEESYGNFTWRKVQDKIFHYKTPMELIRITRKFSLIQEGGFGVPYHRLAGIWQDFIIY